MEAHPDVQQNHSAAWGIIVVMLLLLAVAWAGLWLSASPIAGL